MELIWKKVIHESLNLTLFALIVPFLAKLSHDKIYEGARAAGLPFNVLIIMLVNAFIVPLIQFLLVVYRPFLWLKKKLVNRKLITMTQTEAN